MFLFGTTAVAQTDTNDVIDQTCSGASGSAFCEEWGSTGSDPVQEALIAVIQILSVVAGIIAVIYVIWGGFRFVKSEGDTGKVAEARQTIIYSLVGLVIAVVGGQVIVFAINWIYG
jgi:hypothetical protein